MPGAIAALADLHSAHGRLPWDVTLAPAVRVAREGMPLTGGLRGAIERHRPRLELGAPAWPALDPALPLGARLVQPELAGVLERIAQDGPSALYEGVAAEAIAATVALAGGALTAGDLRAHRTPVLAPVERERLGARISAQPPVSQALLVLIALGAIEASDPRPGADRTHHLVEAVAGAFGYRDSIARDAPAANCSSRPATTPGCSPS